MTWAARVAAGAPKPVAPVRPARPPVGGATRPTPAARPGEDVIAAATTNHSSVVSKGSTTAQAGAQVAGVNGKMTGAEAEVRAGVSSAPATTTVLVGEAASSTGGDKDASGLSEGGSPTAISTVSSQREQREVDAAGAVSATADQAGIGKAVTECQANTGGGAKEEHAWRSALSMLGREDGDAAGTVVGAPVVGVDLVHRGLVNTGNSCFRSVVLQALMACEPFVR